MKKQFLLLILISLFMTNSSYAYSIAGYYNCGKVLALHKDDNPYLETAIVGWFMGFYSGANWQNGYETDNYPDSDSVYYATIKYCEENPLKDNGDASVDIYNTLTN